MDIMGFNKGPQARGESSSWLRHWGATRVSDDAPAAGVQVIEMRGITKRFPGVTANDSIDFDLKTGEVHALLGENAAGKTTLMNILYGIYRPDEGQVSIWGSRVDLRSPKDAVRMGIGMVQQHFALVPNMTVSENVALGLRSEREPFLELSKVELRVSQISRTYGLPVDPRSRIEGLSVGEKQRVEIVKALYRRAKVLILDEPTSVLTARETQELFHVLRSMVDGGLGVVFITHKLGEVMEISDRITVLRRGRVVERVRTPETKPSELAEKMVGRGVIPSSGPATHQAGRILLQVEGLVALNDKLTQALRNVSFSLNQGEVLGVAGVSGNGQRELAEVLTGMRPSKAGMVRLSGEDITNRSPGKLIGLGVGHVPEDRMGSGIILDLSVAENLILEVRSNPPFSYRWFLPRGMNYFLNRQAIHEYASQLVQGYGITTPSIDEPARTLSGGNLQRLILARVLSRKPRFIVAEQPTAGLDVSATEFIWGRLREERNMGAGILLVSGDLNEVMSLSDRVAVMYDGRIAGIVPTAGTDVEEIGLMMGGVEHR